MDTLSRLRFQHRACDGLFSLTPALFLGEREKHSQLLGKATTECGSITHEFYESSQRLFPLPEGEGQGEGKACTATARRLPGFRAALVFIFMCATGFLSAAEDERPVVDASKVAAEKIANGALPTFHIVGDSTVRSGGGGAGLWGWGERIKPFFDTNKINVVNHAIGGRSARTFYTEGRWQKVADAIKPGDFVIIQFGHNDQGRIGDLANKGRADGKGIGDETVEDTKPDGTKELVHTFGWYMAKFVTDAKAKGVTVILCSPIPHKQHWENGRDFATIADWDEQVAKNNGALYFDLTMVVTDAYKKEGADKVATYFADKGTHTSDSGAQFNAARVIAGLKSLPNNPLADFLSEKGKAIETYKPSIQINSTNAPTKPTSP
jgi:lysophospholipase L1-like esterase